MSCHLASRVIRSVAPTCPPRLLTSAAASRHSKLHPTSSLSQYYPRCRATASKCSIRSVGAQRHFSSTVEKKGKNRIYTPVRSADELSSYILSSTSSRTPLLALWTASYCPSCRVIKPLLSSLLDSGVGEVEGGVSFCEVEFDAPDILDSGLGMTYMVNSLPTLMTFDRGEVVERVTNVGKLQDRTWLSEHIGKEAKRRGEGTSTGGGGGMGGSSIFAGLFGTTRR